MYINTIFNFFIINIILNIESQKKKEKKKEFNTAVIQSNPTTDYSQMYSVQNFQHNSTTNAQYRSCKQANMLADSDCLTDNFCTLCKDLTGGKICVDKSQSQDRSKYTSCITIANQVNMRNGKVQNPMYDNFQNKPIALSLYEQANKNQKVISSITDINNQTQNNPMFQYQFNKICGNQNEDKFSCINSKQCGQCVDLKKCVPGFTSRPASWGSCPLPNFYMQDADQKRVFSVDKPDQFQKQQWQLNFQLQCKNLATSVECVNKSGCTWCGLFCAEGSNLSKGQCNIKMHEYSLPTEIQHKL